MRTSRSARWSLGLALFLVASLVQASAPPGQYTAVTGTVTDNKTDLVWQQTSDATTYKWSDAVTHCMNVPLSGTGWRLPTAKELQTLVDDRAATGPTIDSTLMGTLSAVYWTATPVANSTTDAWNVDFSSGASHISDEQTMSLVRCVR